jgi:alginate O-acetyltransferase complex protein AlgI
MVFSSHIFLYYFLPLLLVVYYNLPYRSRNLFLTIANYAFYGWWNPWFLLLMLFSTAVNYGCGKVIVSPKSGSHRRAWTLGACIAVDLALLGFFKYFMFFTESLNSLAGLFGASAIPVLRVTMPIGISFYTFQAISYVVDLYRGDAEAARSFIDYACFISLFPHSVAGPIIRYHTIAAQFLQREHAWARFSSGAALFILGLSKKVLLANPMGEVADAVFAASGPQPLDAWFGALAYAFQIYFDFCGYSDMAVGLARLLGFELIKNFNAPYLADSITDLWRRWHISLSTFLRDYLYVPLGGNRKGPPRTYVNLATVMLLGGLWHGANWTFLAWGGYHGLLLAYERWRGKTSVYRSLPRPMRISITFVLMLFSWILFRAENLPAAGRYFGAMFGLASTSSAGALLVAEMYTPRCLGLLALCGLLVIQPVQAFDWAVRPVTLPRAVMLLGLFVLALGVMSTQAFSPFLYFQF